MTCTNCGTSNLDNATLCINCGRPLSATPPASSQSYTPPPPPPPSYTPPSGGQAYGGGPVAPPPGGPTVPNYLIQSILVTFCCCLPFGIIGIIFATQVNSNLAAGNYNGAVEASRKAKMWTLIGFGTGLLVWLLFGFGWGAAVMQAIREGDFS